MAGDDLSLARAILAVSAGALLTVSACATTSIDGGTTDAAPPRVCTNGNVYRLKQSRNLAYPIVANDDAGAAPNVARGITYDGSALWILLGSTSSFETRLVRFDPDTLAVSQDFASSSLVAQAGAQAYGIAWASASIWVTIAGNTNLLATIAPTTGQIAGRFSSPTSLGPSDLDFDGHDLWLSSGTGTIFRLDPATTAIVQQFPATPLDRDDGIAFRPGEVWVGNMFDGTAALPDGIVVFDAAKGSLKGFVVHDDCTTFLRTEVGPSVFIGAQFVMLSQTGITYFDVESP